MKYRSSKNSVRYRK